MQKVIYLFEQKSRMLNEIFKAYDIRGIYKQTLTEEIVYKIGRALAHFLKEKKIVVGTDMRISSPALAVQHFTLL